MAGNVDLLESVTDKGTDLIENVVGEFRHRPTPSPGRDVGQLVNHMIGWLRLFAARADGKPFDEDPEAYRSGENPAGEFAAAATDAVAAFRDGAAERPITLTSSELPGDMVLGMMLMEYVGHGWDLAIATGQPVPFSDAEAEAALEAGRTMLLPEYRGADQSFGDEVPAPENASAVERFIAFIGRDPRAHG